MKPSTRKRALKSRSILTNRLATLLGGALLVVFSSGVQAICFDPTVREARLDAMDLCNEMAILSGCRAGVLQRYTPQEEAPECEIEGGTGDEIPFKCEPVACSEEAPEEPPGR